MLLIWWLGDTCGGHLDLLMLFEGVWCGSKCCCGCQIFGSCLARIESMFGSSTSVGTTFSRMPRDAYLSGSNGICWEDSCLDLWGVGMLLVIVQFRTSCSGHQNILMVRGELFFESSVHFTGRISVRIIGICCEDGCLDLWGVDAAGYRLVQDQQLLGSSEYIDGSRRVVRIIGIC